MVSAWSAANGISLGQVKVDDKSNEITAIPLLINSLELSGCIVTIDAMGCQKDITQTIIEHDANVEIHLMISFRHGFHGFSLFFCQYLLYHKRINCGSLV